MSTLDHLFEKIADGSIPSYKVYEDEHICAFLDINPLAHGHTLVIPRQKWTRLDELPDDVSAALGRALPRLARAVMRASGAHAYNILCNNGASAGQVVPHVHFHIIPKHDDGTGLPHHWPARPLDQTSAPALRAAIQTALR